MIFNENDYQIKIDTSKILSWYDIKFQWDDSRPVYISPVGFDYGRQWGRACK